MKLLWKIYYLVLWLLQGWCEKRDCPLMYEERGLEDSSAECLATDQYCGDHFYCYLPLWMLRIWKKAILRDMERMIKEGKYV